MTKISTVLLIWLVPAILLGCASGPHPRSGKGRTLYLMSDRDVAEVLLAHCQGGIELTRAIASLKVSTELAALAAGVNRNEENDRAAILSWVTTQQAQPSASGKIRATDTQASHAAAVEQLRATSDTHLDDHVMRVLLVRHNEELMLMEQMPVEDKNLQKVVAAIWRRLSDEVKSLSAHLPAGV